MMDCEETILPAVTQAVSENSIVSLDDGECKVILPFERADRDRITLWISATEDGYRITDHGETYGFLFLSDISLNSERRSDRLDSIKHQFNLDTVRKTISLKAPADNLGKGILNAVHAVQGVSFLSYTRRQYSQVDFKTDVSGYLKLNGYRVNRNVKVPGISESIRVDFSILQQPQPTYLEALHAESESALITSARRVGYKLGEIGQADSNALRIAVVDDVSGEVSERCANILTNWSDEFIWWSERDRLNETLTA
ncbi:DUF1828 domain-containing protein [Haloferacaceae archaeon DSL9]